MGHSNLMIHDELNTIQIGEDILLGKKEREEWRNKKVEEDIEKNVTK